MAIDKMMVKLVLKSSDINIIELFANEINYPLIRIGQNRKSIKGYDKTYYQNYIYLCSKHMANSLIKHGCVPNKTFNLEFPTTIPDNMLRHFCRGYFDGDGCIDKRICGNWRVRIFGTFDFLSDFAESGRIFGSAKQTNIYKCKNVYNLSYSRKKDIIALRNWFYNDSNFYLNRKYGRFFKMGKEK